MRRRALFLLVLVAAIVFAFAGVVMAQQDRTAPDSNQQSTTKRVGQPSFAAEKQAGNAIPDRYIVVLNDDENARSVAEEHRSQRAAEVSHVYENALKGYAAKIPRERLREVEEDPRVQFVSEDRMDTAFAQTLPTGVNRIDGEKRTGTAKIDNIDDRVPVGVAVIDTGINKTHADLNVAGGRNFATWGSSNDKYEDGNGHGTHVAGTIGAKDNASGPVGVAPGASLYGVRVLDNSGSGARSWIIKGIDWVTANADKIKVANMSLGGSGSDDGESGKTCSTTTDAYRKAICGSVGKGITYVVAAGNSKADLKGYVPAAYNEVLTVTAVSDGNGLPAGTGTTQQNPTCRTGEKDDYPATFSNWATLQNDQNHSIALPGVCIYSTWKSGGYNTISGTSMASPHGAGLTALYKAKTPSAAPADVIRQLRADAASWDNANGFENDPNTNPLTGRSYGYMGHADGYSY